MIKKFVAWFIYFGLSFLIADVFGWTDQGRAFMYLRLGSTVVIILTVSLILLLAGVAMKQKLLMSGVSFTLIVSVAFSTLITLFATWGATKLFDIDFFVAYQIMTFGACLVTSSSKKDKDKKNNNSLI